MVPLTIMDANDFCRCVRLNNNVVPYAELEGNGVDDVMNGRVVFKLKERD